MVNPYVQLLYDAMNSQFGIIVSTTDPALLRQKLYPIRKSNDVFLPLSFVLSPVNNQHLWIIKQGTSNGPEI